MLLDELLDVLMAEASQLPKPDARESRLFARDMVVNPGLADAQPRGDVADCQEALRCLGIGHRAFEEVLLGKQAIPCEVDVLRFFESGPIEKAEVVFNIVSEKMRERLRGANGDDDSHAQASSPKKRSARGNQKTAGVEPAEEGPHT